MRSAFVYCASDGDVVKVGSSFYPDERVDFLRQKSKRERLQLLCLWRVGGRRPRSNGYTAELAAHQALGQRSRLDGEWYDMPAREVVTTVNLALDKLFSEWE